MAVVRHLAVVSESGAVKLSDLVPTAAALQIQIIRDFTPAWRRPATVTAFSSLTDVPLDHWPLIVRDDIPYAAQGIHLDKDGSPFSLILYSAGWSLTTSHEALEMLGDPMGNRLRRGTSPKSGQGEVSFLVEVCDPSEAEEFGYQINGQMMSDFYLRSYFDRTPVPGRRYSFTASVTAPCSIRKGGYVSWKEKDTNHWWQQTWFTGDHPTFRDLGMIGRGANPRRSTDGATDVPRQFMSPAAATRGLRRAVESAAERVVDAPPPMPGVSGRGRVERAHDLRDQVEAIVEAAG